MKRLIALLCAAALVLGLTACDARRNSDSEARFYYRTARVDYAAGESPIAPELRAAEGDLPAVLQQYLNGPEDSEYISPFPKNLTLIDCRQSGDTLELVLGEQFAALSGVDLTVARACIALTGLELTNTGRVSIRVENAPEDAVPVVLTREELLLYDNSLEQLRQNVTVYYTDADRRFLIPQSATVEQGTAAEVGLQMVNLLLNPPEGLVTPLPIGTRVLDVSMNRSVCTVNFSQRFETDAATDPAQQRTCLLAITNTLTQLEEIESVEFAVNGSRAFHYGAISTSSGFTWEESAIGPVRTGVNEYDLTLYQATPSGTLLPIPTAVRPAAGSTLADAALDALLNLPAGNGYENPIPAGTLGDLYLEEDCCHITIGGSLLNMPLAEAKPAIEAIVATMTELEGISKVYLLPSGTYNQELSSMLYAYLTPETGWFA